MNTIKVDAKTTKMVAHRGVSGLEKENTCAAFVAAGNRSYYGVETDIHKTGDGNFIIIHDGNTARVGHDNINVEETTFASLRRLQLCSRNEQKDRADLHLPSLEEYISICKQYEKVCVLELKSDFTVEEIANMISRIEALDYLDHVTFIAFGYDNLLKVRSIKPEQTCQFLTGDASDAMIEKLASDKLDIDILFTALTEERVQALHNAGIKINCWTVDQKEDAERLIGWGVDFITSNILEGA
ncbi:MAG: hypothetical protein J6I50_10200 [Clostridia bacterium]|nr:hypothetical protein [Clostridia bacterium]